MKLGILLAVITGMAWAVDADTYLKRAQAAGKADDFEGALNAYAAVLRLKGEDAAVRHGRAGIYLRMGELAKALAEGEQAVKLAPREGRYRVTLAVTLMAQEDPDLGEAESHLRKAVKIFRKERDHPGLAAAYYNLGIIAQKRRSLVRARRYYRLAFDHNPADENIRAALSALDPAAIRE